MKKLLTLTILATLCSALLVFVTCCGLTDGLLKGDPFPFANVSNHDLAALRADYKLMDEVAKASEGTISFWTDVGAILAFSSLVLNIALLWTLRRNRA